MSYSFLQATTDTVGATTYTFAGQNLGSAASDRYIVVAVMSRKAGASTSISSVTVGGVTATIVAQTSNTVSNTSVTGIAIAAVPTGVTGDVVVTFGAATARCAIGLYRADNLLSATAHDTDNSTAADPTVNLDIPSSGFAVATGVTGTGGTGTTWTGLTEDYDNTMPSTRYSGASQSFSASESGRAITADFSASTESAGSFASWAFNPFLPKVVVF